MAMAFKAIRPPPPCFNYRSAVLADTRASAATLKLQPELIGLIEAGDIVLVPKRRFGPVPEWRKEFVEPEQIWLIGTSHVSESSADDVEEVVRALRPENVVVELCRSRAGIMYASSNNDDAPLLKSNMFSLSGSKFFGAVYRSINLGGQSALALRLLLAVFSSKVSSGANRPFGEEFRAARKVSEEIGAQIVLGDRPIEITLERAWRSLSLTDKMRLVSLLFRGIASPALELSNNSLKDHEMQDSPFQLYEQLSSSYPSLVQPLIHERDTYLAWSLKRSKAVNNCKRVVGVIGRGHLNGVVYSLISDQGNLRFRDLVGQSPEEGSNRWITSIIQSLSRDTILAIILWAIYELWKSSS